MSILHPHIARLVTDLIAQQNIPTLLWPAVSPYLSPIEHVWDDMERLLHSKPAGDVGPTAAGIGTDLKCHLSSLLQPSCLLNEVPLPSVCQCKWWSHQIPSC